MKRQNLLLTVALAWAFLGAPASSADEITAFSASATANSEFNATINSTFTSALARITNSTIACDLTTACSGEVATFSLTLDVTEGELATGTLDGTMSGTGTTTGSLNLAVNGLPFKTVTLSLESGPFLVNLFSTDIPTLLGSPLTFTGALDLTMPAGDSITLPNSLEFAIGQTAQTPEPSYVALLTCGVVGLAALARRRRRI